MLEFLGSQGNSVALGAVFKPASWVLASLFAAGVVAGGPYDRDPSVSKRVHAHMLPSSHERARAAIDGRMFRPRLLSHGTATERAAQP